MGNSCPHCGEDSAASIVGEIVPEVIGLDPLFWHCLTCGKAWRQVFGVKRLDLASHSYTKEWNLNLEKRCPKCGSWANIVGYGDVHEDPLFWICTTCDLAHARLWPGDVERTDISRGHAHHYNQERAKT